MRIPAQPDLYPRPSNDEVFNRSPANPVIQKQVAALATAGYIVGDGVAKITVGGTEPTSPDTGDIWIDIAL